MKHKLHEIAKFASGLVLGDLLVLWWLGSSDRLPTDVLGVTITQNMFVPGMIFDIALLIILVHYGWHIGKTPTLRKRTFFMSVGTVFGVVALIHLFRIFTGTDFVILGWDAPLWVSWVGTIVATYLSYMSFHLAVWMKK